MDVHESAVAVPNRLRGAQVAFVVLGTLYVLFWLAFMFRNRSRLDRGVLLGMGFGVLGLCLIFALVFRKFAEATEKGGS